MQWDPQQYGRYEDERARPFGDLLARVGATDPRRVVDLGCGTGALTASLTERWPGAAVEGVDSSAEMIAQAPAGPRLRFTQGTAEDWTMPADTDVLLSNALLQWVPTHRELLVRWAAQLPAGGWLAFQVPGNFDAPSHVAMRTLAASPRWSPQLEGVLRGGETTDPVPEYAQLLLDAGLRVDAWETTYLHVLPGEDPVLEWLRGTGLRPVLDRLSDDDARAFSGELAERLRAAYPPGPHGTLFGFRRVFVVAVKA